MQRPWPPFPWVCFSMCVGVMGTALASPLYPIYQQLWHLKPSDITGIYVVYMAGVLASLLVLGPLTSRCGYLPILRGGIVLVTGGIVLSTVAWNVAAFVTSRLAIGLASGMISTSAPIGLAQLSARGDPKRTAAITTMTMTIGFGFGPLVGGLIAQWAPAPLVSAYLPTLFMGLLSIYALHRIETPPRPAPAQEGGIGRNAFARWLPRFTLPPRAHSRPFWIVCLGSFCAFGMFSLYASLAPSFMQQIVPWHGPAVSGLSIAAILFLSSTFQLLARRLPTRTCAIGGMCALVVCNLLLILTTYVGAASLFALCVLTTSLGHGLANVTGMSLVTKVAGRGGRAGLLSSYLSVGYLGTILPILAVGWLSDRLGLSTAIVIFCAVMALMLAALAWAARNTPPVLVPAE